MLQGPENKNVQDGSGTYQRGQNCRSEQIGVDPAQLYDLSEIFEDDPLIHLGKSLEAIVEHDRDLLHPQAVPTHRQYFEADFKARHIGSQLLQLVGGGGEKTGHGVVDIGKKPGRQGRKF